jgi:hypothetical protein
MLNVCIDVDLTVIDEEGELLPGAIEAFTELRDVPCELTLWSAAGAEYAKSVTGKPSCWPAQFPARTSWRIEFIASPALTPAPSPRRGRIICRVLSNRKPSITRPLLPRIYKPAATALRVSNHHRASNGSSLSPGERARVRASVTQISNPEKHPTSNTQQRTPDNPPRATIGCWMFDVGRSMFPISSHA